MKSLARLMLATTLLMLAPHAPAQPGVGTIVEDPAALQRLRRNSGITLQWITFESARRGHVRVTERHGRVHLSGRQTGRGGALVDLEGDVLAIGPRSFTFQGVIRIENTPDQGRECIRDGTYEFRITRNRRYWRLQQMTVCDGLTDYVDIYF
ncbi:hypothetical protein [Sphingosinicella sp.]|uniref:hypothetical protein n=1 Tax=Sphingosinicella sp. TaxID=1917971 RepID=UPI0040376731